MDDFSSDHIERNGGFYSYGSMSELDKKTGAIALTKSLKRSNKWNKKIIETEGMNNKKDVQSVYLSVKKK